MQLCHHNVGFKCKTFNIKVILVGKDRHILTTTFGNSKLKYTLICETITILDQQLVYIYNELIKKIKIN